MSSQLMGFDPRAFMEGISPRQKKSIMLFVAIHFSKFPGGFYSPEATLQCTGEASALTPEWRDAFGDLTLEQATSVFNILLPLDTNPARNTFHTSRKDDVSFFATVPHITDRVPGGGTWYDHLARQLEGGVILNQFGVVCDNCNGGGSPNLELFLTVRRGSPACAVPAMASCLERAFPWGVGEGGPAPPSAPGGITEEGVRSKLRHRITVSAMPTSDAKLFMLARLAGLHLQSTRAFDVQPDEVPGFVGDFGFAALLYAFRRGHAAPTMRATWGADRSDAQIADFKRLALQPELQVLERRSSQVYNTGKLFCLLASCDEPDVAATQLIRILLSKEAFMNKFPITHAWHVGGGCYALLVATHKWTTEGDIQSTLVRQFNDAAWVMTRESTIHMSRDVIQINPFSWSPILSAFVHSILDESRMSRADLLAQYTGELVREYTNNDPVFPSRDMGSIFSGRTTGNLNHVQHSYFADSEWSQVTFASGTAGSPFNDSAYVGGLARAHRRRALPQANLRPGKNLRVYTGSFPKAELEAVLHEVREATARKVVCVQGRKRALSAALAENAEAATEAAKAKKQRMMAERALWLSAWQDSSSEEEVLLTSQSEGEGAAAAAPEGVSYVGEQPDPRFMRVEAVACCVDATTTNGAAERVSVAALVNDCAGVAAGFGGGAAAAVEPAGAAAAVELEGVAAMDLGGGAAAAVEPVGVSPNHTESEVEEGEIVETEGDKVEAGEVEAGEEEAGEEEAGEEEAGEEEAGEEEAGEEEAGEEEAGEEEEEEDEEEEEEEAGGAGGWGAVAKKGMVDPRTTVNNKEYRIEKAVDFIKKSFKYEHDDAVVAMTHAFFLAEGEYSFIFKGIPHDENAWKLVKARQNEAIVRMADWCVQVLAEAVSALPVDVKYKHQKMNWSRLQFLATTLSAEADKRAKKYMEAVRRAML